MLTTKEAACNIRKAISEKSLIQVYWSYEDHGKRLGCVLHQMGGMDVDIREPDDCPASVIPKWLAFWLPSAFDAVRRDDVYAVADDFASTLELTIDWTPERWERMRVHFLCGLIDMAVASASPASKEVPYWAAVVDACNLVKEVLRGNGDLKAIREAERAAWEAAAEEGEVAVVMTAMVAAANEVAGAARAAWEAAAEEVKEAIYREQFAMLRRLASA